MKCLVTGAAGFIGFHLSKELLKGGHEVFGIDNLNDYYDVRLKENRLNELGVKTPISSSKTTCLSEKYQDFNFFKLDITDKAELANLFEREGFDVVCNFAAQAGVMHSTINPSAYTDSNIIGFINILDCCKRFNSKLIYASSSSVYGDNSKIPFSEKDIIDSPKNLYAKTKIKNEQLAQIYSDYFNLHAIGLRLFSVFGPFGRPDMGYMIFSKAIKNNEKITIYGDGEARRDYTFIDDVVTSIIKLMGYYSDKKAINNIFNIGTEQPVSLLELVRTIEDKFGSKAIVNYKPSRNEEILTTYADSSKLKEVINYKPCTKFNVGMKKFLNWFEREDQ